MMGGIPARIFDLRPLRRPEVGPCSPSRGNLGYGDGGAGSPLPLRREPRSSQLTTLEDDIAPLALDAPGPRWPALLVRLSRGLHTRERTEAWLLLHTVLTCCLKAHAVRMADITPEDVEDLAAQKAEDLVERIASGRWRLDNRTPAQVAAFVSRAARNSLLDLVRSRQRWNPVRFDEDSFDHASPLSEPWALADETPELNLERKEYAAALRRCVSQLQPRSQRIWFLRAFCAMTSKEIARHPEVRLKTGHVDVLLQRCRELLRRCMQRRGYQRQDMPPGTFVELWTLLHYRSVTTQGDPP